jgi:hypothetical protein
MLPDSFGPEGSDQLIRLAQTAYENQGLDLNNIPDIGRGICMLTSLPLWAIC